MPTKLEPLTIEPCFRVNGGRRLAFGPGKAELLEHIDRTGSIRETATAMGMSYMRAWSMVKSLDSCCVEPAVRKVRGGNLRGGAELTDTGRALLAAYRELEKKVAPTVRKMEKRFAVLLAQ